MKEKVFLAGTDDVKYIMESLYNALTEMGLEPIWFHKKFPIGSADTMEECLTNVKLSDRLILVLDSRYGLPARSLNHSITEEEFLSAYRQKKPVLIFVTRKTWEHSKIYHKLKKENIEEISKKKLNDMGINADKEIFEFIERIQHLKNGNENRIAWIEPFDLIFDIINQINSKWDIKFDVEFDTFIAPWVLPNEEIPMHITWNRNFDFTQIVIDFPDDLNLVEVLNVNKFEIKTSKIILEKKNIRFIEDEEGYTSYFGIVFVYKDINFDTLKLFRDIKVTFKNSKEIIEEFFFVAKIFRPKLINITELESIIITDKSSDYKVNLNLETQGFGYVSTFLEVKINKDVVTFNETVVERIIKKLKKKYSKLIEEKKEDTVIGNINVNIEMLKKFLNVLEKYSSEEEEYITDYFTEENVDIALWVDFIIELIKEVKIQNRYENILLKSPSLVLPEENFNEIIKSIVVCINYEDLNNNKYSPVEIPLEINDTRIRPQKTIIDFKIKIDDVIDNSFYDIENVERNKNGEN